MCAYYSFFILIFAHYSSIILNSFSHLLFSKLCQHNLSRPTPNLQDNDHQFVPGVTPSTNGTFVTTRASVNSNWGTTDDEHFTDPAPCLCHASPNHVPVPRNNQDAQVNAVPKCDSNDQGHGAPVISCETPCSLAQLTWFSRSVPVCGW